MLEISCVPIFAKSGAFKTLVGNYESEVATPLLSMAY